MTFLWFYLHLHTFAYLSVLPRPHGARPGCERIDGLYWDCTDAPDGVYPQ